jgi:molybdenum cofactor biosynthesis protein B
MSTKAHKAHTPKSMKLAIVTVSTTRSLAEDKSGQWIKRRAKKKGHDVVFHEVAPDQEEAIADTVRAVIEEHHPHAILITGGTGIGPADVTIEAVRPMFT